MLEMRSCGEHVHVVSENKEGVLNSCIHSERNEWSCFKSNFHFCRNQFLGRWTRFKNSSMMNWSSDPFLRVAIRFCWLCEEQKKCILWEMKGEAWYVCLVWKMMTHAKWSFSIFLKNRKTSQSFTTTNLLGYLPPATGLWTIKSITSGSQSKNQII